MEEPFLMLARRYFDHAFWQEPRTYSRAEAWLDCVQLATFQPRQTLIKGALVSVPRGGIVASVRFLSDRWQWSRTKVCSFLEQLEAADMIKRQQKGQDTTLFLLCNYDKYNRPQGQRIRHGEDTGETPERQNKERKEGKKGEGGAAACPDDSTFIADLAALDRAQALGLLQRLFPDRDVWGNWLAFKKARQEQGRKPDWKGLVAWLRKAAPIADLGHRRPSYALSENGLNREPISLEEQQRFAEQFAEYRRVAGL